MLRVIRIAMFLDAPSIEPGRIADFYLSFPMRPGKVKFPKGMRGRLRAALVEAPATYGTSPADDMVMRRMRPIQDAAIQTLVGNGSLDANAYEASTLKLDVSAVSESLHQRAAALNEKQRSLVALIRDLVTAVPLEGENGLKHRTGLGEHRYDAV